MDNPLIYRLNKQSHAPRLGRKQRKQDRINSDENKIEKALIIFKHHLPEMYNDPPEAKRFTLQWPKIIEALTNESSSQKDFQFTHNELCKRLAKGNKLGLWDINVPEHFYLPTSVNATRNTKWQHHVSHWGKRLKQSVFENDPSSLTHEGAFAHLLLSCIIHSGFVDQALWIELARRLKLKIPFIKYDELQLLWLHPQASSSMATNYDFFNVKLKDMHKQVDKPFIPDPISLGLIKQFLKRDLKGWKPPKSKDQCLIHINQLLGLKIKTTELRLAGIALAEQIPGVNLPQAFIKPMLGNRNISSVNQINWEMLVNPTVIPATKRSYKDVIDIKERKSQKQIVKKSKFKKTMPDLYSRLRNIFSLNKGKPKREKQIITELNTLYQKKLSTPESLLIHWCIDLYTKKKIKPSSILRYLTSLGRPWLIATEKINLYEFDADDFIEFYQDILSEIEQNIKMDLLTNVFEQFHQFLVIEHQFPSLPFSLSNNEKKPHVDAGVISERLFRELLIQFSFFMDLNDFEITKYQCFVIIAFRAGLRIGEIAKLQMLDVENSDETWLFIRRNKYGHNKRESSKRKIPLMLLLTDEEKQIFKNYQSIRQSNSQSENELFFFQGENKFEKLRTDTLSRMVGELLSQLSGNYYFRFHHLRHSALSRMQLLIHSKDVTYPDFIDNLLPYSENQRENIIRECFGKNRKRDRYYALARFAGHDNPNMTFKHYLHFTDFIISAIFQNNLISLDDFQAKTLLNISLRRIKEKRKNESVIHPSMFNQIMQKHLSKYSQTFNTTDINHHPNASAILNRLNTIPIIHQFYFPSIEILERIANGKNYTELMDKYKITQRELGRWKRTYRKLNKLMTSKGKPRLFPSSRNKQFLPPKAISYEEQIDIDEGFERFRKNFRTEIEIISLKWPILYLLTNCNSSRSGIYFDNPEDYHQFMNYVCKIYPLARWRFEFNCINSKGKIDKKWQYKSVETIPIMKKQTERFKDGSGWLQLKHRNESNKINSTQTKYSSNSLRTLFHRFAIILFTEGEINKWQDENDENNPQFKLF